MMHGSRWAGRRRKTVEIEELKSVYLDVKKGVLKVNGQEIKNVTEFSMTFKDG